jgi:hypothetical protein
MKHLRFYEEFSTEGKYFKFTLDKRADDKKAKEDWDSVWKVLSKNDPSAEIIKTKDGSILVPDPDQYDPNYNEDGFMLFFKSEKSLEEVKSMILSAYKNMGIHLNTGRMINSYSLKEVNELPYQFR